MVATRRVGGALGTLAMLGSVVSLCAGCGADAQPGVKPTRPVTPEEALELHSRALDLLLRAAAGDLNDVSCNAIEALVEVAPREGLPAFRAAIQSESPLVRYAGFVALGQVRDTASVPAIRAGLNDSNPLVRLAAAFAAYRCGKTGAARLLVRTLTDSPEENERAEAAALLGRLEEPQAERWLRAALRYPANDRSNRVTLQIYGALAQLGRPDAVRELNSFSQADTETRTDALLLLARIGHPLSQDVLRFVLNRETEYLETRLLAARGLARCGLREGFDFALRMALYKDPNRDPQAADRTFPVRSTAIHALAEYRDPRALPILRDIAADPSDARLQVAAAYAICRITAQ